MGVPWPAVRMLLRCERRQEMSGREIRGEGRAEDQGRRRDGGKVRRHGMTQSVLGMASGRWVRRVWKNNVG